MLIKKSIARLAQSANWHYDPKKAWLGKENAGRIVMRPYDVALAFMVLELSLARPGRRGYHRFFRT
jgi:hypothetical protein